MKDIQASTFWYGFSHRLDVPSVGLILTTKTHEDYYDLRLQLSAGSIARNRIVCCHRWLRCHQCEVKARALWNKAGAAHSGSQSMPCCTWLWFLAHAYHQIRCHALHAGDSIRREGKQSPLIECESDLKLCAWNFLHRHRRAFRDGVRATHEVLASSPRRLSCSSLKAGAGI